MDKKAIQRNPPTNSTNTPRRFLALYGAFVLVIDYHIFWYIIYGMEKLKCRFCKAFFTKSEVIKNTKIIYNNKEYQYYACNTCNTAWVAVYRKTKTGREAVRRAVEKSENRYPGKQEARVKLRLAILSGKIRVPKKCVSCKQIKKLDGHHPDYNRPLEVVWLCRKCHIGLHKKKCYNIPTTHSQWIRPVAWAFLLRSADITKCRRYPFRKPLTMSKVCERVGYKSSKALRPFGRRAFEFSTAISLESPKWCWQLKCTCYY